MTKSRFAHRADARIHQAGRGSLAVSDLARQKGFGPAASFYAWRDKYGDTEAEKAKSSEGIGNGQQPLQPLLVNAQQKYQWLANPLRNPTFKNGIQTPFPCRAPSSYLWSIRAHKPANILA